MLNFYPVAVEGETSLTASSPTGSLTSKTQTDAQLRHGSSTD